jgi:hypothetical protein
MAKTKTKGQDKAGTSGTKTKCPLTREEFTTAAKPLAVQLNGQMLTLGVKEFATGSFGYFCNDKITVMVGDIPVKCQANLTLIAVGSKDADGPAKEPAAQA